MNKNNFRIITAFDSCTVCNGAIDFKVQASGDYDRYSCDRCALIGYGLNHEFLSSLAGYELRKSRKLAFYYVKTLVVRKMHRIKLDAFANNDPIDNPTVILKTVIGDSITWLSQLCDVERGLVNINFFDDYLCQLIIEKCKPHYVKPKNSNAVFANNYKGIQVLEITRFFLGYELQSGVDSKYQKKNWLWLELDKWY